MNAPDTDAAPLVLDSPHSGTTYPADFDHISDFMVLRRAEDTYIHELYADASSLGATLMGAHFPRSYIDTNRGLDEMDVSIIDGDWPDPVSDSEKAAVGIGLIWRVNQKNVRQASYLIRNGKKRGATDELSGAPFLRLLRI